MLKHAAFLTDSAGQRWSSPPYRRCVEKGTGNRFGLQFFGWCGDVSVPSRSAGGNIVLDLNLPRHDGIEILERLRGTERLTLVPVIVLTSSDSPRDRNLANGLGTARFLRKPSNLEEFLSLGAVFKELLGQAKAQSNGI